MLKQQFIKLQPVQTNSLLCLNPYCTLPFERVFSPQHEHNTLPNCLMWITQKKPLRQINAHSSNNFTFAMGSQPMSEFLSEVKNLYASDWKNHLESERQRIMNAIEVQITKVFDNISQSIDQMNGDEFCKAFSQLIEKDDLSQHQNQIESLIQLYVRPLSMKKIYLNFRDEPTLQIPSLVIDVLSQKYFSFEKASTQTQLLDLSQNKKFQEFFFHGIPFNKIQQICSMCSLSQARFQNKKSICCLACPLCPERITSAIFGQKSKNQNGLLTTSQLKQFKKRIANKMLHHLWDYHYEQVYSFYANKHGKENKIEKLQISYNKLTQEIRGFKKLVILDRESGIKIDEDKFSLDKSNRTYFVQFLSRGNMKMAKIMHVLTGDRFSTEFMITYAILDICFNKKIIELGNVQVISNSWKMQKVIGISKALEISLKSLQKREDRKQMKIKQETIKRLKEKHQANQISFMVKKQDH